MVILFPVLIIGLFLLAYGVFLLRRERRILGWILMVSGALALVMVLVAIYAMLTVPIGPGYQTNMR